MPLTQAESGDAPVSDQVEDAHPIPSPTMPLPETPRQDAAAAEHAGPTAPPPLPAEAEPADGESPEKGKSVFGWAGKIFRS